MALRLDTPIIELFQHDIAKLSANMARKLAQAVAGYADKSEPGDATVEDLLNYFPMRYEDRSNFLQIDQLYDGIEASVELYARVSGGFQVGKNRGPKQPPLYIFEVSGGDRERTRKPVVVWGPSSTIRQVKQRFHRPRVHGFTAARPRTPNGRLEDLELVLHCAFPLAADEQGL